MAIEGPSRLEQAHQVSAVSSSLSSVFSLFRRGRPWGVGTQSVPVLSSLSRSLPAPIPRPLTQGRRPLAGVPVCHTALRSADCSSRCRRRVAPAGRPPKCPPAAGTGACRPAGAASRGRRMLCREPLLPLAPVYPGAGRPPKPPFDAETRRRGGRREKHNSPFASLGFPQRLRASASGVFFVLEGGLSGQSLSTR
jgi:hypothetical protein